MSTNEQHKAERQAAVEHGREALRAVLIRHAKEAGRPVNAAEINGIVRQMMATRRSEMRKARAAAKRELEARGEVKWFSWSRVPPILPSRGVDDEAHQRWKVDMPAGIERFREEQRILEETGVLEGNGFRWERRRGRSPRLVLVKR
jgi:hypothetical protein